MNPDDGLGFSQPTGEAVIFPAQLFIFLDHGVSPAAAVKRRRIGGGVFPIPPGLVKLKVLFNFHRIAGKFDTVIIVEGPLDLVAVHQAGFPNVVAVLGKELIEDDSLSYDQLRLVAQNFSKAILLLDGDENGKRPPAGSPAAWRRSCGSVRLLCRPAKTPRTWNPLTCANSSLFDPLRSPQEMKRSGIGVRCSVLLCAFRHCDAAMHSAPIF